MAFSVDGLDLLVTPDVDDHNFGCLRDGAVGRQGAPRPVPLRGAALSAPGRTSGVHAIHGTVHNQPWVVEEADPLKARLSCLLGPVWPVGGLVRTAADPARARSPPAGHLRSRQRNRESLPGQRRLASLVAALRSGAWTAGHSTSSRVDVQTRRRGGPNRDAGPPTARSPWDDCFTELSGTPEAAVASAVTVAIDSTKYLCVVVYDQPTDAICVEPQNRPTGRVQSRPRRGPSGRAGRRHRDVVLATRERVGGD